MAEHEITCIEVTGSHQHVEMVGVGTRRLHVSEVYQLLAGGDTFYVGDGEARAVVSRYSCDICGIRTLRSHAA
ncbi:MAG: hypothetical protein JO147_12575, partial [Actinobacteria bacterium]|nr:hypothetical protein [Actinomycetota bacterium]